MQFKLLAEFYELVEKKSARLEMMDLMAELFRKAHSSNIDRIIYLSQGVIAPEYKDLDVGIGEKFVMEAIERSTGYSKKEVEKLYKKEGDLGIVAEMLLSKRKQGALFRSELTVEKVYGNFLKMAQTSGYGSQEEKITLLVEMLNDASPIEGKFIVRFPIGKLRLGLGDATIIDALSSYVAGDKSRREEIERAYNLCSDLGLVGRMLFENKSVANFKIRLFTPVRPALAERLSNPEEIIEKIGPCIVDAKYDGFRCQIHKKGDKVEIYSRKLEKTTKMFPEIVEAAKQLKVDEVIFEGEALAYDEEKEKFFPFQLTMQRKRKYDIDKMQEKYPLKLFVFDVLFLDGEDISVKTFAERRKILEKIFSKKGETILQSEIKQVENAKELGKFFEESIGRGLEGIIAKDLNQPYVAGARKFAWIKLKKSYALADTIDVVIVGYYLGKGQRSEFGFGGALCAVYDSEEDMYRTVAKIGSGFSEEEMKKMKEMLEKIKRKEKHPRVDSLIQPDFWVDLKYVISVAADEITKSPLHTAGRVGDTGYALRFPRMVSMREDKAPEDATTVEEIVELYGMQQKK